MAESVPGHLLSLKVMRVSRPALASAWQPFYSSSPSFSVRGPEPSPYTMFTALEAHSTASILSLQGKEPLEGHPKTLRDSHANELLILPSNFGAIQLGETFSSCLCVNNEAQIDISAVSIKVEMQTVTAKVLLGEFGGSERTLTVGDTLENVVHHEIKELGQHVLACTVSYRLPPGSRTVPGPTEDPSDPALQTFRKFYKFAVTNPLSVKTKVHATRSPSALMSATEREKVLLEVHIQNLTPEPLWFERMRFECVEDWDVVDANIIDVDHEQQEPESIFSGSMALMQPQDMRQYIYILSRKATTLVPVTYAPGSVNPLGRLDISWRSSYGEPGRLLTSMLSRRIPLLPAPAQQPASALPSYLKRNTTSSTGGTQQPRSPQLPPSRPGSPSLSQRPASPGPFRNRPPSALISRTATPPPAPLPVPDVEVSISVRDIPRDSIKLETPFKIGFTLVASAPVSPGRRRSLTLAIQHLQPPRTTASSTMFPPNPPPEPYSPRLMSPGFSTPSPMSATFNYALAHQKLSAISPEDSTPWTLPPPFFQGADELKSAKSAIVFTGASAVFLQPLELTRDDEIEGGEDSTIHQVQDFELSYMPLRKGFSTVGGLRAILLEDKYLDDSASDDDKPLFRPDPKILKEWEIVAEVWVS